MVAQRRNAALGFRQLLEHEGMAQGEPREAEDAKVDRVHQIPWVLEVGEPRFEDLDHLKDNKEGAHAQRDHHPEARRRELLLGLDARLDVI